MDNTSFGQESVTEELENSLPVYGLPGKLFYVIHGTALFALPTSALISAGVLVHTLPPIRSFYSRPIGDRLVVYLAICDLFFSLSHMLDHAYMVAVVGHPPDAPCAAFAFFLHVFFLQQSLIVLYAASNAFLLVVLNKRTGTGRYDWRLMLYSYGPPVATGILGLATGYFGPAGAWCYIDAREKYAAVVGNLVSALLIATFLFTVICYVGIWLKIRQVARSQTGNKKYNNTARVMMLFVAAYILQWWGLATYSLWAFFGIPHVSIFWAAVFFSNLGGLFNFIAYTFIKKKYQKVAENTSSEQKSTTVTNLQTT